MISDMPKRPLPLPDENEIYGSLVQDGGNPIIPKDVRKTLFPVVTKEDLFGMLLAQRKDPKTVLDDFAEAYKNYVGAAYAIPTSSGTSSLQLALAGAGVLPGDEVLVPALTFIATAQAVVAAKAIPIFVDVDPRTFGMDPAEAEKAITPRTRAIMPVHVHGLPVDTVAFKSICTAHNLAFVEDASHAHSASVDGQIAGSIGDTAGQSLMADKNFPVGGEGGIAFFRTDEAFQRAQEYLQFTGINMDMSWIAAAFGSTQLSRLPYYDAIRQRNADILSQGLLETSLFSPPYVPTSHRHSYNMYRLTINTNHQDLVDLPSYAVTQAVHELLVKEGVPAREWQNTAIPFHTPFQARQGFGNGYPFTLDPDIKYPNNIDAFPHTKQVLETSLTLCRELRSPVELERITRYVHAFKKIDFHIRKIREIAKDVHTASYDSVARLG